jgi:hypothetical protein
VTSRASWNGTSLTVTATRSAERCAVATPETAASQDDDLTSTHVLTLDASEQQLTIETTVSDEKGNAEYRQVFRRSR